MPILTEIENTPAAWSERAEAAETPWEACGWTRDGQRDRMRAVLAALKPRAGDLLLDYGCGTGELVAHLPAHVDYVGYDSASGMVIRAQREHPGHRFRMTEPTLSADLVACVGTFNLADHWQKAYTWQTLRRLLEQTGRALAVSLYAGADRRCLVYTETECEKFARSESYRWTVERWRHNDLLMVIGR